MLPAGELDSQQRWDGAAKSGNIALGKRDRRSIASRSEPGGTGGQQVRVRVEENVPDGELEGRGVLGVIKGVSEIVGEKPGQILWRGALKSAERLEIAAV